MEKKVYARKIEKVIDFLIGFLGIPFGLSVVGGVVSQIGYHMKLGFNFITIVNVVFFLAGLGYSTYIGTRRKFIGLGLLFAFVAVPLVLLGTCLLIMGGGSILGQLFRK